MRVNPTGSGRRLHQSVESSAIERWVIALAADREQWAAYQMFRAATRCERWVSARAANRQRRAENQSVRSSWRCQLGECAVGGPAAAGGTPVGLVIGEV